MTARTHLARRALATTILPGAAAAKEHVEGCLACQASAAHDRRLQRRLALLRHELIPAPAGLVTLVLARMEAAPGVSVDTRADHRRGIGSGGGGSGRGRWWRRADGVWPLPDEAAGHGCTLRPAHR